METQENVTGVTEVTIVNQIPTLDEVSSTPQEIEAVQPEVASPELSMLVNEIKPVAFSYSKDNNVRMRKTGIYTVTLPSGVYWVGDVASESNTTPPQYAGTTDTVVSENPFRALPDGRYALLLPTYNNVPGIFKDELDRAYKTNTGSLGIAPAVYGKPTPDSCSTHVFFDPFTVVGAPGYLSVENDIAINAGLTRNELYHLKHNMTGFISEGIWATPAMEEHNMEEEGFSYVGLESLIATFEPEEYWMGDLSQEFNTREWEEKISTLGDSEGGILHFGGETITVFRMPQTAQIVLGGKIHPMKSGWFGVMLTRNIPPYGSVHTHFLDETTTLEWNGQIFNMYPTC